MEADDKTRWALNLGAEFPPLVLFDVLNSVSVVWVDIQNFA